MGNLIFKQMSMKIKRWNYETDTLGAVKLYGQSCGEAERAREMRESWEREEGREVALYRSRVSIFLAEISLSRLYLFGAPLATLNALSLSILFLSLSLFALSLYLLCSSLSLSLSISSLSLSLFSLSR